MMQLLNNWLKNNHLSNFDILTSVVFMQSCLLNTSQLHNSLANHHGLCEACLSNFPWHPNSSCPQCGLTSCGQVCGSFISLPPDFDKTILVFLYAYRVDAMMQPPPKYGSMLNISYTFGQLLGEKTTMETDDLIIPMPMHPARIKERGFNHAHEISKVLTKNQPEKLNYTSALRQKLTSPHASLPLKARVKNIKGAFAVNSDLKGKKITIIDDVMTTDASLNELAKTLKKDSAAHLECWVIARTLPHK